MPESTLSPKTPRRGRFSKSFKENDKVISLLKYVSTDNELDAQLRDGYINIYYNGGNVLRIEQREKKGYYLSFDKFYFYDDKKTGIPKTYIEECLKKDNPRPEEKRKLVDNYPTTLIAEEINKELEKQRQEILEYLEIGNYNEFFSRVKQTVGKWIEDKGRTERKKQHWIACTNRAFTKENNLVVIDLEFAVSTLKPYNKATNTKGRNKVPKIDIVAVNKEGQIYCIELKDKKESDKENSPQNIQAHKEDFDNTVGSNCEENDFTDEMTEVLEQKQNFELIGHDIFINTRLNPIFAIAYSGDNKRDTEEFINKYKGKYPIIEIRKSADNHYFLNIE